jgi:hypothetical protein
MGYSLHTPCRTKKDRDQMVRFLKKHYRPFSVLAAGSGCLCEVADLHELNDRTWKHTDNLRGPLGEDLSYIPDTTKWYIGFDFGSSMGGQGHWAKDFLRWVATKVGKTHQFEVIEGEVPYIVYDIPDDDWDAFDYVWPVLEKSEYTVTKDMRSFVTDHGFRGWAQQAKEMREFSMKRAPERAEEEGWNAHRLKIELERRAQRHDLTLKVAKRADKYIKRELRRLDALWEAR